MIIEMRTYTLQPGTIGEAVKRFGEALPIREKHSPLVTVELTNVPVPGTKPAAPAAPASAPPPPA